MNFKLSKLDTKQWRDLLKVAAYVGVSAALDFLISATTGTQFGPLTPVFNLLLVTVKKMFTEPEA
jgi:hypothetical protein